MTDNAIQGRAAWQGLEGRILPTPPGIDPNYIRFRPNGGAYDFIIPKEALDAPAS